MAGQVSTGIVSLGSDLAPGRRRGARRATWKRKQRFQDMRKRHRVLQRYTRALPRQRGRMGNIYTAGVLPAATFGSAIVG
eukprot:7496520-Pyramimonas_sp.AAC.1